ncbi:MAG: hypothetical protein ACRDH9_03755 [Actinomycetota bacterium]
MDQADGVRLRDIHGRRSTQEMGRSVFAAAARAADAQLADEIERERDWRKKYLGPVRRLVEAGARSRAAALGIARAGLAELHDRLEFTRDGQAMPLPAGTEMSVDPVLGTETVLGEGRGMRELAIPYRGDLLTGDSLRRQIDAWVEGGIIEPSCREAVEKVVANPDWLDLSDRRFAILGGASEMGAMEALSSWGADIAAIDLPAPHLWERILETARAGRGRLQVPTRPVGPRELTERAGADLLTDLPEIGNWLRTLDAPFTIVDDIYADGSRFVLVAAATDALAGTLARRDGVTLAYLATPTDVFAVPEEIALETRSMRRGGRTMRALSAGALYKPSYGELFSGEDGKRWGIVDCLVGQQGANYALAKTLQRWRAVTAREDGTLVSANVAPATRTKSVTKNKALAAAYRGAGAYGLEIFEPETSRWLMAALLVHDLRNEGTSPVGHPFDLYAEGAAHGGIWRLGFEPRSILPLAVARGIFRR